MDSSGPLVVAVVGSPRRGGNTAALVAVVQQELAARGASCETILLGERRIGACLAHGACGDLPACLLDDDAPAVLDRVYAADCLVLGTPVYYENVSAQLKALIDRNVFRYLHDEWLRAKAVGLIAVAAETGLEETLDAMRRYVALSSARDIPVFTCAGHADEAGAAAADAQLVADARELGRARAEALGLSPA